MDREYRKLPAMISEVLQKISEYEKYLNNTKEN